MSSPNTRAKGSSSSRSPAYLTGDGVENHAIEVRSKLYPFVQKNLDENVLHLFKNTLVLGPHWFGAVPKEMAILFRDDVEAPLDVRNSAVKWLDWINRLLPRHRAYWKRAGIYDENLLAAALCFWNSASNTFDFCLGPMTPTLLDMAQIFGFRPHGLKFSIEKDRDHQHMLFLLYWLNRFIFPNCSSVVLLEHRHLAEALPNHTDVGLGPTVLAHLYKNLHTATLENPVNLFAPGAFWMIQVWLQVYFPKLRFPDIVLPED
ncbi:unnamed protein product [Prunus armeniaca]